MLDTHAITYFEEVARTGSLRAASASLLVATSAIGRQIRLLEEYLSVALFRRHATGMELTREGSALLDYVERLHQEQERFRQTLRRDGSDNQALLRIATVEGLAPSFLPKAMASLAVRYPNVSVRIDVCSSRAAAEAVTTGAADIGFVFGSATRADVVDLATVSLPIMLAVRPTHPLVLSQQVSFADMEPFAFVLPNQSFGLRREVDRAAERAHVSLRVAHETNALSLAIQIAQESDLCTFATVANARSLLYEGTISLLSVQSAHLRLATLTMIRSSAPWEEPLLQQLAEFFQRLMTPRLLPKML